MASKRVIPVMSFEPVESQNLPSIALDRMCQRPNFNRAPRGWGADYNPESNELWKKGWQLKTKVLTCACSPPPAKTVPSIVDGPCSRGGGGHTPAWYRKMLLLCGLSSWGKLWTLEAVNAAVGHQSQQMFFFPFHKVSQYLKVLLSLFESVFILCNMVLLSWIIWTEMTNGKNESF